MEKKGKDFPIIYHTPQFLFPRSMFALVTYCTGRRSSTSMRTSRRVSHAITMTPSTEPFAHSHAVDVASSQAHLEPSLQTTAARLQHNPQITNTITGIKLMTFWPKQYKTVGPYIRSVKTLFVSIAYID